MAAPKYFMDIINDNPDYQRVVNYRIRPKSVNTNENPDDRPNVLMVVLRAIAEGLVPSPKYKGDNLPQEEFMYLVILPQGFISDGITQPLLEC